MMKNKKPLEQRSYLCEVRSEKREESGNAIIKGRPIVYESKTDLGLFDEIIEKGALDDADLTDVRFLINHDLSRIPIARSRRNNGNSTMKLTPDAEGMEINAEIDIQNNSDARSLNSAVERGDISGMSFMFTIDDEDWENLETEHPLRRIKKIGAVIEVSAVTFPAYTDTSIQSRGAEVLESARAALDRAKEQRADIDSLESEKDNIELLKLKNIILGGF